MIAAAPRPRVVGSGTTATVATVATVVTKATEYHGCLNSGSANAVTAVSGVWCIP